MAEIETITILRVDTGEAVKNVAELRQNIEILRDRLKDENATLEENQENLKLLSENQAALKSIMYGSAQTMEQISKAAKGTGESYNALVKQMATLKAQLRNVDTSTEEGRKEFEGLAADINTVNLRLKDMDAMMGNYQRNVGDYSQYLKGFHNIVKDIPPSMNAVKKAGDQLDKSMALMSANPIIGIIAFIAPLINKIADGLKDNEKATAALQKAMKALEPVMQFFEGILDKIADALAWVVDQAVELAGRSDGLVRKITTAAAGVGNAVFQFLITPFRTFVEIAKGAGKILHDLFTGNFKDIKADAQAAGQAIGDAVTKGFTFKANFETGQTAADTFISGVVSSRSKKKAQGAGSALAKDVADGFEDMLADIASDMEKTSTALDKSEAAMLKNVLAREKERLAAIEQNAKSRQAVNAATVDDERRRQEESYRIQQEGNEKKLAALQEFQQAAIQRGDLDAYLDYEQQVADMEVQIEQDALDERARIRRQDVADAEAAAQAKAKIMQEYAAGVGNVLGAIANLYDINADKDKRSFENSKRFQIAETWVNTLAGMASAIWATWNDKTIPSAIAKAALAATNAAGILASGIATTAKIRATQFGSAGAGSAAVAATAPTVSTALPQVLQTATASDVERLNRAAEPSRVYILQSDIEAAGRAQRVRVQESTF